MDCGKFVKIGVSGNVDNRKNQIPYKVEQYYCTEPIENAFDIEQYMHNIFSPVNAKDKCGREYFEADFEIACKVLKAVLNAKKDRINFVINSVLELANENCGKEKFDKRFYEFLEIVLKVSSEDLCLIGYVVCGLAARREMIEKKELQEA